MSNDRWYMKGIVHFVLLLGVAVSIFPFYWLIVMATTTTSEILRFPPRLTFGGELWTNISNVLANINFFQAVGNTLFVSVVTSVGVLFFCSLAGFTFAKFEFPGKNLLFIALLLTMMIPAQMSFVPSFLLIAQFGWVDSYKALIIPSLASAFGIFWIRQFCQESVPDELLDAGRLDGCSMFRLYWNVALPTLRPALTFLGIFTFINVWNDYLWPLVTINSPEKYTLQVMLAQLNGVYDTDYAMIMAGTLMATLPLIILFIIFSRQFMAGVAEGAVKE
ncbi:carbohydrate ABC transporter permease [Alkalicoccobacillus porphyridii]|uniref:Carbohydrate ABC transporter permease n=1 Tax=Alkalicoccobacillus porphyridii TaxID=2597270 RepID=A0A553ZUW6_9BACI|nr:carbohydrate ABC transporter permease [Alkalicoccobacillus porphyridii]TSB45115.1 carbohydrate ABC transporter permease [Alkalicoccobacillus porphyridii]